MLTLRMSSHLADADEIAVLQVLKDAGRKRARSGPEPDNVPSGKAPRKQHGKRKAASPAGRPGPSSKQPRSERHQSASASSRHDPPPEDDYSYSYSDEGEPADDAPAPDEPAADERGELSLHDVDLHSALALQFRNMAHALRALPAQHRVQWAEAVAKAMGQ